MIIEFLSFCLYHRHQL